MAQMIRTVYETVASYPPQTVLYTILALLLTFRFLPSLVLAIFLPSLGVKTITPLSIKGLTWRSEKGPDALKVEIKRISWTAVGSKSCGRGWIVLRLEGVRVFVPKTLLTRPPKPRSSSGSNSSPAKTEADSVPAEARRPAPDTPLRLLIQRLLLFLNHRLYLPLSDRIRFFFSSLAPCLSLFALEISAEITLEGVARTTGIVSAGVELTQRSGLGATRTNQIGAWVALDQLRVVEVPPHTEDTKAKHTSPSPPRPPLFAAIEIAERVSLTANAPVDPELGLVGMLRRKKALGKTSVEAGLTVGEGREGVHVRVHELKRILRCVEDILREKIKNDDPSELENDVAPQEGQEKDDKPTPLYYLRSLSLSLPLFILSAHYNTPLHILATSPNRPLPQSVAFALTVKKVIGELKMAGTTDGDTLPRSHKDVLGKGRSLGAGAKLEWGEIEGRVKIDGAGDDILPDSAKAFAIGRSSLLITSTWLPPAIAVSLASTSTATCTTLRNLNDDIIIAEGHLGEVRGHATFETLDSALRIFKARPRPAPRHSSDESKAPLDLSSVKGLPKLVATFASEGVELRIQAPRNSERKGLGEDTSFEVEDRFYRNWTSPDLLCVSFPNGSLSFGGEYQDRSVRRSEAERRAVKRYSRRTPESTPDESRAPTPSPDATSTQSGNTGSATAWSPTKELEDSLGVPPPPPLKQAERRHLPSRPTPAASQDLDVYSLQYSSHFHLAADTLNIYILATNDGFGDDEATSWLGENTKLPSDPIRFDILAVGPIELSSEQLLLGTEIAGNSGTPIPSLELASHTGSLNILIETLGIDLWRPPVMGCLRDCLTSIATARASSTYRGTHSPPSKRPSAPYVYSLPFEICTYIAVASFDMRVAGSDPKNDEEACRGIAAHSGAVVFEYVLQGSSRPGLIDFPTRQSLELREDIRVEANANLAERSGDRQAFFKVTLSDFNLDPVVDARTTRHHLRRDSVDRTEESAEDWELKNRAHISDLSKRRRSIVPVRVKEASKGIIGVPELAVRVRLSAAPTDSEALDKIVVTIEAETPTFRFELFTIYLCLVAYAAVKSLVPVLPLSTPPSPATSLAPPPKRPPPLINLRTEISDLHIFIVLPHNVPLFAHIRRLRLQVSKVIGVIVEWDMLLLAGHSPTVRGKWDDIFRLRIATILVKPQPINSGYQPFIVSVLAESARLRIPFRYVFSQIVDNTANLVKAVKQLIHQLVKGGMNSVLEPEVEPAKKLPEIRINFKMMAVEIQDDPFETRLNIIWRAGYEEQIARQERRSAFDAKVEAIRKVESNGGVDESSSDDEETGTTPRKSQRVNGRHSIAVEEAEKALNNYDSSHWAKRMRNAVAEQGRREDALRRRLYGTKNNQERPDSLLPIELLPKSQSAPLARATFQDLHFNISRHSYDLDRLPDYLFDVGKGLPRDTQFTLLVPFHFSWKMQEARVQLRDYPLPLLHLPPMPIDGEPDHAVWECESDLVIGEEFGRPESVRRVPCAVVPAHAASGKGAPYTIVVPRSAMTTKTYAVPTVTIRTPYGTRIGWGNSIQPAIQDVAKVLDTLTKATPDPSERIGFWDKLRLQFHWRVQILFQGEGPVHFHLKGTRDPYALTGFGAGFVKTWRGNVKFLIGLDNPDREFFQILSDEYVLGIPNLREYVDAAASGMMRDPGENDDRTTQYSSGTGESNRLRVGRDSDFVKVCAKFINGVRWGMGAVLEQACPPTCQNPECRNQTPFHRQCRFFDFIDHWQVHTKTAASISPTGEVDDSFAGFRSDFIHFSISLTSPLSLDLPSAASDTESFVDRDDEYDKRGYNSLHFSPQAGTHFWAWWKLFDGTMSLPIRQGKLFPSAQPPSKKFGKHCATIKYRFSLAPLFLSHTYRQDSWTDWANGETTVVGVKGKVGRFNVDLHQREQEDTIRGPETLENKKVLRKAFYQAEVDLDGVDLRVLSAVFREPEKAEVVPEDFDADVNETPPPTQDYSVGDEDLDWVDLDDFADAIYSFPDRSPRIRILPFLVCPRFTYYRQSDVVKPEVPTPEGVPESEKRDSLDDAGSASDASFDSAMDLEIGPAQTKFGKEPSHTCLMGCADAHPFEYSDTIGVQLSIAQQRLRELEMEQRSPTPDPQSGANLDRRIRGVHRLIAGLLRQREKYRSPDELDDTTDDSLEAYQSKAPKADPPYGEASSPRPSTGHSYKEANDEDFEHIEAAMKHKWDAWENRYMVHSPSIQVSNVTREILLKYYYSSRERKGFMYHLSASAIKFIRDLAKNEARKTRSRRSSTRVGSGTRKSGAEEAQKVDRLLDDLLKSDSFWADSGTSGPSGFAEGLETDPRKAKQTLPDYFQSQAGHLCLFIKPQFSLQSDVDAKSTIILTASFAELEVHQVVDRSIPNDPVNRQVLNQTFAFLDGLQAFYPRAQSGAVGDSSATFLPLETLAFLRAEPLGFDRVVPHTRAALRYDKFNQLRMASKYDRKDGSGGDNGDLLDSHFHTRTDRISVECAKFSVSANPDHFAAIYNVVTDLLLYSDPLQKKRAKKLEELVFTHDFSRLGGVADIVAELQHRIRELVDLGQQFQVHLDELDDATRLDLFYGRAEGLKLSSELNLVVQAISRAQNFSGASVSKTAGIQFEARAAELVWHMLDQSDTPFAKFSVADVDFSWISKQDSSISNRLIIRELKALNSSPDHIFAEIISKHTASSTQDNALCKMNLFAAILWNSLPPVGGISIVEQLEIHLHPVRLQLEHRVGKQILDYLFSQRQKDDEDESEDLPAIKVSGSSRPPSLLAVQSNQGASRSAESLSITSRNGRSPSGRPLSVMSDQRSFSGPPSRSSGALSGLASSSSLNVGEHRLRKTVSTEVLAASGQEEGLDADEMRRRASLNRTFILVDISSTVLYLTYHSEKDDHSRLPDVYNLSYSTPIIQYRSKTWSFLDLLDELKKDTIKSVWSQKGQLIGQLLQTAHRRLPLQETRSAAKKSLMSSLKNRLDIGGHKHPSDPRIPSPSPLRRAVPAASPSQASSTDGHPARTRGSSSSVGSNGGGPVGEPEHVFGEQLNFVSEPDKMSMLNENAIDEGEQADSDEDSHPSPKPDHHHQPSNASDLRRGSIFPIDDSHSHAHSHSHGPTVEGFDMRNMPAIRKTVSKESDEAKAVKLLGKSLTG